MSPLAIAPMIDWTYSHFRVFMRMLAPNALLYTEMQTSGAIRNKPERALYYQPMEQPIALQLGGADKEELVYCAQLAEEQGYAEVNLNLGCPSDRVQSGRFGACMMTEPDLVAECIYAMKQAVSIPVTAKTRIGIDHQDSYSFFSAFARRLVDAGCDKLIVHARKAWLNGLSPKQNRTIPPLHYEYAYNLKKELGALPIVINGNIATIDDITQHLANQIDGVMLGRLVCNNPYALAAIHHYFYPDVAPVSREEVINEYIDYLSVQFKQGVPLSILLKPVFNFAHGMPGAKGWKEQLMLAQRLKSIEPIMEAVSAQQV
ncbi:tRNA dihydrouridine(20/20a) synthase DusA [Legionella dresdenensis]|uniref:tRNA-dihydrouridine synthase n=1 Tax=Legionella dresdenensis TaxID=450200 RepID=A0ABV8CBX9_9GAMM